MDHKNINLKVLLEEGVVGFEVYPKRKKGGQSVGIPQIGTRCWYPKQDNENPNIDIRVNEFRNQIKNRDLCFTLMELALESL